MVNFKTNLGFKAKYIPGKGQIKPKADWPAIDSPKKTKERFFFAMTVRKYLKLEIWISSFKYFKTVKQKTRFIQFLVESTGCQSAYGFI